MTPNAPKSIMRPVTGNIIVSAINIARVALDCSTGELEVVDAVQWFQHIAALEKLEKGFRSNVVPVGLAEGGARLIPS